MTSRALAVSLLALSACAGIHTSRAPSLVAAAKRGSAEPIEIVVCGASVPQELSAALDVGATIQAISRELWDEPLFRVRAIHAAGVRGKDGCVAAASARGFMPDIWIYATAQKDDATVRIRTTGNLMADPTLTVRLEVASTQGAARLVPSASGPVDEAISVVVDAARAARSAILDDIAPDLPSHASTFIEVGGRAAHGAMTAMSGPRALVQP